MKTHPSGVLILVAGLAVLVILAVSAQVSSSASSFPLASRTLTAGSAYERSRALQPSTNAAYTVDPSFTPSMTLFLPAIISGTYGFALRFDGLNDYVSITNSGQFNFDFAFSVEAWVKPLSLTGSGKYKAIVVGSDYQPPNAGGDWVLFQGDNDYSSWGLSVCVPACNSAGSAIGSLQAGQWQHLAATYDNANIVIYRNGEQVASRPHTGNVNEGPFILLGLWGEAFDGLIADVRLWNIARSSADILADMGHPLAGDEPGLVGYWPLDEGMGQAAVDRTIGHADGRLGSTTQSDDQDPTWIISDRPVQ